MFMIGDFNCDMLNPGANAIRLERMMSEYGLLQMISCPTRVTERSATQIDLMFTSDSGLVREAGCKELGLSDHCLIYGVLDVRVERQRQTLRMIRCLRRCDQDALIEDLRSAPWQVMDSMMDITDRWEFWKQLIWEIIDSHIPLKRARVRSKSLPWINHDIRALMRARSYYATKARKARKSKEAEDWEQYRRIRNLVTHKIRKAKLQYFEGLSEQSKKNPRKAWKEVNRVLGSVCKRKINSVRADAGFLTDRQDIADEFARYFSLLVGGLDDEGGSVDVAAGLSVCENEFKFDRVEEDVLALLRGLDPNKAVGTDGVSATFLRITASGICRSLTSLFNYSLECGELPDEWKSAHVTPVPKGGDSELMKNFRPVCVLPVVAKVFERVVHRKLYTFLRSTLYCSQISLDSGQGTLLRMCWLMWWMDGERQWMMIRW